MHYPLLSAKDWLALKIICGKIFMLIRQESPIHDDLHYPLLIYMGLPLSTTVDYCPFGSIQFKAITPVLTLVYMHAEEPDKRQVFLLETPAKYKPWHSKR